MSTRILLRSFTATIMSAALFFLPCTLLAEGKAGRTLSQQLLDAYFETAGVCTTSYVREIRDEGERVVIEIEIDPGTIKSVESMNDQDRDAWFSLHCPPEIHGVWYQANPPSDILVLGQVSETQSHQLSCADYQQQALGGLRELTLGEKFRQWIRNRLD